MTCLTGILYCIRKMINRLLNGYTLCFDDRYFIRDQFMLGDSILVAPVVEKNKIFRKVSFPAGTWQGDDNSIVSGPAVIEIDAPLDRLPWFRLIAQ